MRKRKAVVNAPPRTAPIVVPINTATVPSEKPTSYAYEGLAPAVRLVLCTALRRFHQVEVPILIQLPARLKLYASGCSLASSGISGLLSEYLRWHGCELLPYSPSKIFVFGLQLAGAVLEPQAILRSIRHILRLLAHFTHSEGRQLSGLRQRFMVSCSFIRPRRRSV